MVLAAIQLALCCKNLPLSPAPPPSPAVHIPVFAMHAGFAMVSFPCLHFEFFTATQPSKTIAFGGYSFAQGLSGVRMQ